MTKRNLHSVGASLLLGSVKSMILYPEAQNQHPIDAIDVLRIFLISIPIGVVAYLVGLLILLIGTVILRSAHLTLNDRPLAST
jgi:hypothetical protein